MKTAVIFDQIYEAPILYFVLDGDYLHLHDVYANSTHKLSEEVADLFFNQEGQFNHASVTKEEFVQAIKDGAELIVSGLLP